MSPLGAIPKHDSEEVRIIHDCSRPQGKSLNNLSVPSSVCYETVDHAFKLATPNSYMCKIDLHSAYRSVPIHPYDYNFTGLQFHFSGDKGPTYMVDCRLPFGSNKGPMIFHRISQAVKRMMARRGYENIVVYLDDFLCIADSYEKCVETQNILLSLLIELGFEISWKKATGVSQVVEFLGITIDSRVCSASLSSEKVKSLLEKLKTFESKRRASKKQLQSLVGSLNWATQVIRGGRFFLHRILESMNNLREQHHKCKLSADFMKDLKWWIEYLSVFNGIVYTRDTSTVPLHSDACGLGGGVFTQGMWRYFNFESDLPEYRHHHINYKEVITAVKGVIWFAPLLQGKEVLVITDSTVAKAIINKGRSKNKTINIALREMFWVTESFNIKVRAIHLPGVLNQIPDSISRLHEVGQIPKLYALLSFWFHGSAHDFEYIFRSSMSTEAYQYVNRNLQNWLYGLV